MVEQCLEASALLICKPRVLPIGLRILQINLLMCHIHISTHHHGLLLVQLHYIVHKISLPCHAVVQPFQSFLGIGGIDSHHIKVVHLQRDDPALMVVLVNTYSIGHLQGLLLGIDGCSRISFFVSIIPKRLIARKLQIQLTRLHLGLLQTEEVGIHLLEYLTESLPLTCSQSVHIPRYKFSLHCIFLF